MDSFFGSFNQPNYSTYEEQNDSFANLSTAMNRSRLLLNEMVANPNQTQANTTSRLLKPSVYQQQSLLSNTIINKDINIDQSILIIKIAIQFLISC